MFKRKKQNLVIPQFEHTRLAATIANHFDFSNYDISKETIKNLILSAAFHDRALYKKDLIDINEMKRSERKSLVDKYMKSKYENFELELFVMMHHSRLLNWPGYLKMKWSFDERINEIVQKNNLDLKFYKKLDSLVGFFDHVSYDFCYQEMGKHKYKIFDGTKIKTVQYKINEDSIEFFDIKLKSKKMETFIFTYKLNTYPKKLEPSVILLDIIN